MGIMKNCKKLLSVIVTLLLAASLLTSSAFAISGEAFIATPGEVNLRDSGSFNSNVIDAAPQGATVYVLGDAGYGWYKVSYNGKTGYMASYYLLFNEVPSAENVDSVPDKAPAQEPVQQPAQEVPSQTYVAPPATGDSNATVLGSGICFRSGPSTYSSVIETLETGTPIRVNGVCGSWYECVYNGSTGYIYGDYVVLNGTSKTYTISAATVSGNDGTIYSEPQTPDTTENTTTEVTPIEPPAQEPETPAETPAEPETPAAPSFSHNASAAQAIVDTAMQYLGVPYVLGRPPLPMSALTAPVSCTTPTVSTATRSTAWRRACTTTAWTWISTTCRPATSCSSAAACTTSGTPRSTSAAATSSTRLTPAPS